MEVPPASRTPTPPGNVSASAESNSVTRCLMRDHQRFTCISVGNTPHENYIDSFQMQINHTQVIFSKLSYKRWCIGIKYHNEGMDDV